MLYVNQIFFITFRPKIATATVPGLIAGRKHYIRLISGNKEGPNEIKLGFERSGGLTVHPITKKYLSWKYQGNPDRILISVSSLKRFILA